MKPLNLLLLLLISSWMFGALSSASGMPGENIAKGKRYMLFPRPNYRYCTDPGDKIQLTDGIYTKGYFWTQRSTVGWEKAHPVIIVIDLDSIQPISGVSYSTAAGTAGVNWPSILILVSDDGRTYTYVGDLIELSAEHGMPGVKGYARHRFWTDKLRTHGRYVAFIVNGNGPYVFVDEIEVYRGPDSFLEEPLVGKKTDDLKRFFHEQEMMQLVKRRLRLDLAAVRSSLKGLPEKGKLARELDEIGKEIKTMREISAEGFKAVLPFNDLHRRIFSVQAAIWREMGFRSIVIWKKNRWDMLSPTEPPREGGAEIEVAMMRNEYRGAAFNISNAGPGEAKLRLSIMGLPGGVNPDYITVHEVPFTDTKSGIPVAAALPLARKKGRYFYVEIPEGMTRQIWLTFHPSKDMPSGEYTGKIAIEPTGNSVPIRLKVYPFTFPDQPTLHLGGWDYTDRDRSYEVTPKNRKAFIKHLQNHFVDTPWATSSVMPRGKYDKKGDMIEEPSTENFRRWIERWPNARNYYVFLSVRRRFSGFEMGTPEFENAVSQWIRWWVKTLREWNIKPKQLGLLLVDEPSSPEKDRIIIEYAGVIQRTEPEVVIWEDPTWRDPWKGTREMFELCDVLCPNMVMWINGGERFADFYIKQRKAGKELWFYACSGPGKLLDPYSYHRMEPWFCWRYGAKGAGYWAFGDSNGASSWNEYLSRIGAYTPLFLDEDSVTAGKHMEAIREGIEDYEYLRILRDRIAELKGKGVKVKSLNSAEKLLETAARRVTACMTKSSMIYWKEPKDRSVADKVRVEILEVLLLLR
ncbi:hypothetical protein J7M22_02625 [Candidatus Poribacteria bacterium]|nr:hypothetical protein [Candidatus Poribacteria bacterium]